MNMGELIIGYAEAAWERQKYRLDGHTLADLQEGDTIAILDRYGRHEVKGMYWKCSRDDWV